MVLTLGQKTALSVFVKKMSVEVHSCDGVGSILGLLLGYRYRLLVTFFSLLNLPVLKFVLLSFIVSEYKKN